MTSIMHYLKFGLILIIFLQNKKCEESDVKSTNHAEKNSIEMTDQNTQTSLTEVKLKRYGGMMGHVENLRITQDSIYYSFKNKDMHKPKKMHEATPVALWDSIAVTFDEKVLANVKDGEMKVAFDGIDNIYTLEGDFETQEFRNPTEHPTTLNPFFDIIDETRAQLYDAIRKN